MCGIAGYFSKNKALGRGDLQTMLQVIAHRGPDAEGIFDSPEFCALGHRRLSIIDLSMQANQPMYSHDNRYVMVYNGEVYNYKELAESENLNLKTSSDTEVILELFSKYGIAAFEKFNGMFAMAIYDTHLDELYLSRDRVGIKPLYFYYDTDVFVFASELKAIKTLKLEVNKPAVYNFLHLGYIPAPQSIYKNVFKLKAGHWLKISVSGISESCYWKPEKVIQKQKITDEKIALTTLDKLLNESVSMQMRSDVPFGVFLSGGTDSSIITALAVKNSASIINTFSIGFKEKKQNEAEYAKAIASHLKTNHHEFIATYDDALQIIDKVMLNFDEPFADSSALPTYLVSHLASKHVKVVLSGDGGDELFYGYGAYTWAEKLQSPFYKYGRFIASKVFSNMNSRYQRVSKLLQYNAATFLPAHIFSQEQYLYAANEVSSVLCADFNKDLQANFFETFFNKEDTLLNLKPIERQALFDLNYYLPDDLLVKVDRTSMMHSIEARVPLLDHHLVEFALNLSTGLKIKNGVSKYLLKQVLYQYLPKPMLERPKQGFSIPLNNWLHKELFYLIEENLNEKSIREIGVLNFDYVEKLIIEWKSGSDFLFNRIWQLIILQQWFKANQ